MLKDYQIANFKAFAGEQRVRLRPITLIYGQNSSGKSSLLQSLLMLKQTTESLENPEMLLIPKGSLVDLGGYREFINGQVRIELNNLQSALQAILGASVQVFVKEETKSAQCPHGRYLITDQVALLIERGFELLWDDASMATAGQNPATDPRPVRDVAVVLCSDCAAIETHTKLLPNY